MFHGSVLLPCSLGAEEGDNLTSYANREVRVSTSNKVCSLLLEAHPLPVDCVRVLEENVYLLKALNTMQSSSSAGKRGVVLSSDTIAELRGLRTKLSGVLQPLEVELGITDAVDLIWSLGPRNTGPNVLLNMVADYTRPSLWQALELDGASSCAKALYEFDNSIVSGFQLATLSGPLCEEPMQGVCISVKEWIYSATEDQLSRNKDDTIPDITSDSVGDSQNLTFSHERPAHGPLSGQLISAMKGGCRSAFLVQPARLMAAMYKCNILASAEVLGKVYSVLGRRNGSVLSDDMIEGSAIFNIEALIPVAESFGFAEEMRKRSSGFANPQLMFSHWEVCLCDGGLTSGGCCVVCSVTLWMYVYYMYYYIPHQLLSVAPF